MAKISEDTIVDKIIEGDSNCFAIIVDRYKFQIYNLMYRFSGSTDDAADMTQDVFLRAFERLVQYKQDNNFFAWLYTLALNYAKDWSRKKKRDETKIQELSVNHPEKGTSSPDNLLEAGHTVQELITALDSLTVDKRELILLRYRHERPIKEIADILNISESAVKMRIRRTLDELSRILNSSD